MLLLERMYDYPLLTKEDEIECYKTKNYEKLVLHNIRLAAHIVNKKYVGTNYTEDLIAEAIIGLYIASTKFNPKRGRFTTIAHREITRRLHQQYGRYTKNLIYLPDHVVFKMRKQREKEKENQ